LVTKADEKVVAFEKAVKATAPYRSDSDLDSIINGDLNAASAAHEVIGAIKKQGASAYSLVSLLATMDDLNIDAAKTNFELLSIMAKKQQSSTGTDSELMLDILSINSSAEVSTTSANSSCMPPCAMFT
jgi:hypothetical protein